MRQKRSLCRRRGENDGAAGVDFAVCRRGGCGSESQVLAQTAVIAAPAAEGVPVGREAKLAGRVASVDKGRAPPNAPADYKSASRLIKE